ncbi:Atg14 domain-containing protein [Hymenobacter lucidus]|uniref:Atg14 domain-containing protein n=1 Tax=Hymenobacter lucidus TaxID=2880930 RepID=A0ABS8AVM1_9BACT|nr:Atg14 domain-containing protein [Hymenobacter lucidus]MCB2409576.1 Atg14 domain-containing protein [Hymenobacter lucidus]
MATPDFSQLGGSTEAERRSFWSRPEGILGLVVLAGLAGTGLFYFNEIVKFLIEVATNTLHLAFLLGGIALLVFLFTSRDIRTGLFFLFKTLMRKITGLIIQLDPIAILKIYIEDLKEKRQKMQGQIDTLAGQMVKLNKKINENNEEIKQKFAEANKATSMAAKPGMKEAAQLATIEGAGLQQMNEKLLPLQRNIKMVLAFMEKVNTSADYIIKETEIKVRLKEVEYKMVKESSNALRTAVSIFKGDPDKKFYFDESMEYIQDDMSQKLGEMKRAMDMSMDFINSVDVQNGVLSDKGEAMLQAYNQGDFKLVTLDPRPEVPAPSSSEPYPAKDAGYRDLLN